VVVDGVGLAERGERTVDRVTGEVVGVVRDGGCIINNFDVIAEQGGPL
jgi:hypothetical protein